MAPRCTCKGPCLRCRAAGSLEFVDDIVRAHRGERMSYRQIAAHEGLSASRVEQIEKAALAKLARILGSRQRHSERKTG